MRRQIVATLGPSTDSLEKVIGLMEAGINVARLNMSHGDHLEHMRRLKLVRDASHEVGRPVGVFADLQGENPADPVRERLRDPRGGAAVRDHHRRGARHRRTLRHHAHSSRWTSSPATRVLVDDGSIDAVEVTDTDVITEVVVGGRVSNNKGIQPARRGRLGAGAEREGRAGSALGAAAASTWWRLSFVRSASDYDRVREIMDAEDRHVPVIAKIEKPQAIDNLPDIIDTFDAVMVAAATWASNCRPSRCRRCRNGSSKRPANGPSR